MLHRRFRRLRGRAPALRDRQHLPRRARLQHAVAFRPPLHERDTHRPRARPHGHAQRKVPVGVERVLLPRRVARHGAGEGPRGRGPRCAAHEERRHAGAVDPHLEPLPVLEAAHVVVELPPQPDADLVLSVGREVVPDRDAAARPERQVLAHALILEAHAGQAVRLRRRRGGRMADREPRDPAGREEVAVEQGRRHRERVGDVVEAVIDVVRRQERGPVHLQAEQIAHRVDVLAAVEAVGGLAAGIRVGRRRPVEGRLQGGGHGRVGRPVGPRPSRRRHRAGAELRHHLLPRRGMLGHTLGIQRLEREAGRPQPVVVAGEAVAPQGRPRLDRAPRRRRRGLPRGSLRGQG